MRGRTQRRRTYKLRWLSFNDELILLEILDAATEVSRLEDRWGGVKLKLVLEATHLESQLHDGR